MLITGLILILFWCYFLQLLELQTLYSKRKLNPSDANGLVSSLQLRLVTTPLTYIFLILGIVLCFIGAKWYAILWIIGMMLLGGFIRDITGNPLIGGKWDRRNKKFL